MTPPGKRKTIIVASAGIILITLAILAIFLTKNPGNNAVKEETVYADDSQSALQSFLQDAQPESASTPILVYGDLPAVPDASATPTIKMSETCTYSGQAEPERNYYTIGSTPQEVKNHCVLLFQELKGFWENDYLNAYVQLPDNSLIVLSTKGSPSIQINIYKNEIRIVQLKGYVYYRVAQKTAGNRFSIQIADTVLTDTGTEIYTQAGYDKNNVFYASYQLIQGGATIALRGASQIIRTITASDDDSYDQDWQYSQYSSYEDEGNVYSFSYENGLSQFYPAKALATVLSADTFLKNQINLSLEKYNFKNFSNFDTQGLQAFTSEQIENAYQLNQNAAEKAMAERNAMWEKYQKAQEATPSTSSGSSSGSGSTSGSSSSGSSKDCYPRGSATAQLFCGMSGRGQYNSEGECCVEY